jgi:hypothetical protein
MFRNFYADYNTVFNIKISSSSGGSIVAGNCYTFNDVTNGRSISGRVQSLTGGLLTIEPNTWQTVTVSSTGVTCPL